MKARSLHQIFQAITGALMVSSVGIVSKSAAADFDWNAVYGGTYDWQYHSHWSPDSLAPVNIGVLPNAATDVANLNFGIFGNQNILLNGGVTLGTLNLGDAFNQSSIVETG